MQGGLIVPSLLIVSALLIIVLTVSFALWDGRKNRPVAERGIEELSIGIRSLPPFAVAEFSAELDSSRTLLRQKRYRECIRRTDLARQELDQVMEVVRQGRSELISIESKVMEARDRGLTVDRAAIWLDGVSGFWGVSE